MIEIKNLNKSYGTKQVLSNFNLTVPCGSIFGLVGINGAGKSTLLRLIAGVFRADSGSIAVDGEEIYENATKKREMFFLPDEPYFNLGLSGEKLRELYRVFYNFDDAVFLGYISKFKLDMKTSVRDFSKGMRRQLYIALAFACSPKYLLLDEAFDGLDPLARLEFKRGLIELGKKTECTVIISSHSLRELEDICDSFGLIDNGGIASYGNIAQEVEKLGKYQAGFDRAVSQEELDIACMTFETSGRIIRFVTRESEDVVMQKLEKLNPLLIDKIPVDFEELFVGEVASRGYLT